MRHWLILLLLLFPSFADAATRYVDNAATGCSNPDTDYDPGTRACGAGASTVYTTNDAALAAHAGGDLILYRGGTFTENGPSNFGPFYNTMKSGTVGAYTTYMPYNGETVIFQPAICLRVALFNADNYITFSHLFIDGRNCTLENIKIELASHHVVFDGLDLTDNNSHGSQGILGADTVNNIILRNSRIHHVGTGALGAGHCVYTAGTENLWLIEKSEFDHCNSYGLHLYPGGTNFTIRDVKVHDNGYSGGGGGQVVIANDNHVFEHSIVYSPRVANTYALQVQYTTPSNITLQHLVLRGSGTNAGVYIQTGSTGITLKNSVILDYSTAIQNDAGAGFTQTDNVLSGTATDLFVDPVNGDYTLKAGSALINAGTDIGQAYNSTFPDQGAFEVPVCSSAEVGAIDATSLILTCTNNVFPPLASVSSSGFSVTENAVPITINSCAKVGDNIIDCTLNTSIVTGRTVLLSYNSATGTVTDSALIGNSSNQKLLSFTDLAVTNNVGAGPPAYILTQAATEFHALVGPEDNPSGTPQTAPIENTNVKVAIGGAVRLRFAMTCTTADCPSEGYYPFYSCPDCTTAGTYTQVPDEPVTDEWIGFCGTLPDSGVPSNGTPTTNQLSTAGTFVAGAIVKTSNAIPTVVWGTGVPKKVELEYCFRFSGSAVPDMAYDIRLRKQNGSVLDVYTITPRMTTMQVNAGGF